MVFNYGFLNHNPIRVREAWRELEACDNPILHKDKHLSITILLEFWSPFRDGQLDEEMDSMSQCLSKALAFISPTFLANLTMGAADNGWLDF